MSHEIRKLTPRNRPPAPCLLATFAVFRLLAAPALADAPALTLDLAQMTTAGSSLHRTHGFTGNGTLGVPVAGGGDCDGDGHRDIAFSAMRANPLGRNGAGEVYLVFGDGTTSGTLDTAVPQERILRILGDGDLEAAGSELWMDDVTGDGLADLLICRQNYVPATGREGAGALTIVVGGAALRAHAATLQPFDLRSPPPGIAVFDLIGPGARDRLGIWTRTGDITGDGIADIAVGADQQAFFGATHAGAVYVVRGGAHLASGGSADLASFGSTSLAGHLARILPPLAAEHYHFGATVQVADLDGNGRAEVLAAAALARAGASLPPTGSPPGATHSGGGSDEGSVYVAWDDHFPAGAWNPGFSFRIDAVPARVTVIHGGTANRTFGEELLGGLDYDGDGGADLFVGDLLADGAPPTEGSVARPAAGLGHVFFAAASLKGLSFDLETPPMGLATTTVLGPISGSITADTALHGDFDGDGFDDLALGSPHDSPFGREDAGTVHVLHGRSGVWPAVVDLQPGALPPASQVRISEIYGAHGDAPGDVGDTLCYSAASGDIDADGRVDLIVNEMAGNGLAPGVRDVGNLIVVNGRALAPSVFADGFEAGDLAAWTVVEGMPTALVMPGAAEPGPSRQWPRR